MAVVNPIDSSTTVSSSSAGMTVNLLRHTTMRLSLLGVPMIFKVRAEGVAGDTGVIRLLDPSGVVRMTVAVNGTKRWYWATGYLPAVRQKYDLQLSGNTIGTLKLYSAHVYAYDWTQDGIAGGLVSSIGTIASSATGTVNDNRGSLSSSIGTIADTAAGTVADNVGSLSSSIGTITDTADGTVATPAVAFQALGTGQAGGGGATLTTAWPTHLTNDVAILVVVSRQAFGDPGAATLSTANGFVAVTGGSDLTNDGTWQVRTTLFWCRATSGSMASPVVGTDSGSAHASVIITFRGCVTSGDPTDGTPGVGANSTSNTSVTAPGPTTTGSGRAVLIAIGYMTTPTTGSYSNGALTSITEQMDANPSGGNAHITLVTATKATAGAVGNTTATLSGAETWTSVVIALKP